MSAPTESRREGSLEAPLRHALDWQNPQFYDEQNLFQELERVFDICHGCRRCFNLCNSFPTLFDAIDASDTLELDGVPKKVYWDVVDHCYLCDMCFMTKCPYVPPHEWNLDFPHLMLRAKAVKFRKGEVRGRDKLLTSTDLVGSLAGIPVVAQVDSTGYPKNEKIVVFLKKCIESFRGLPEYGEKVGVKITIENHRGLCANPLNIRIIMDEVNHPYCECTPDFCNWENEYHLFHGLEAVMPYTHTHVHAKYWDRWKTPEKDWNDVGRSVRILNAHRFKGTIALDWENGPMDGIEGTKWLMKEVLAAL